MGGQESKGAEEKNTWDSLKNSMCCMANESEEGKAGLPWDRRLAVHRPARQGFPSAEPAAASGGYSPQCAADMEALQPFLDLAELSTTKKADISLLLARMGESRREDVFRKMDQGQRNRSMDALREYFNWFSAVTSANRNLYYLKHRLDEEEVQHLLRLEEQLDFFILWAQRLAAARIVRSNSGTTRETLPRARPRESHNLLEQSGAPKRTQSQRKSQSLRKSSSSKRNLNPSAGEGGDAWSQL